MKPRASLFLALILLTAPGLGAQTARMYISESGLPCSQMNDIFQDRKGFIWIATENGLARFDGMNFMTLRMDKEKSSSLAANHVIDLFEDSGGTMWVGTSAGLQTFDPDQNTFCTVNPEGNGERAPGPHISSMIEIRHKGRPTLLAASSGHGVYALDLQTRQPDFLLRSRIDSVIRSGFINHLFQDNEGLLWISAENGGLCVMDPESGKAMEDIWGPDTMRMKDDIMVEAILDAGDRVVIGSFSHGILFYDKKSARIRQARDPEARYCKVRSLLRNNLIATDSGHSLMVGLENGGLRMLNLEDERLMPADLPNVQYHMDNWKVHCLMEDSQGNVWLGAFQTGVLVLPKSMYGFDCINITGNGAPMDESVSVTSILGDERSGSLWIGSDGDGVYQVGQGHRSIHYSDANSGLDNNSVMDLATDGRGRLWVATYLGGLFVKNPGGEFRHFSELDALNMEKTVALACSREDNLLYVGSHGSGLAIIDLNSDKVVRQLDDNENKWISTLYLDSSGMLWVGTYNGPMCYDHKVRKLIQYSPGEDLSARITCFREASDGRMWIGTGRGLVSFDRANRRTKAYTEADGLPDNVVMDIQESLDGHLWISTQNGLSRMDPKTGDFKNYYQYDGLQGNEFLGTSSYRAKDGKLYFGGIRGVSCFYPHIVYQRSHPVPPLYLTKLTVMNSVREYDPELGDANVLDRNIIHATQLTLPYDENIFSLEFSVLEYTNPNKIVYAYMVEGFDSDWHHAGPGKSTATYTNLPAGRYKMKVKAFFDGEPEEFSYREMGVRILPPWYGSWWAFLCYGLLAALAAWGVLGWVRRRKKIKKDREESETKDLRLRMFTDITHEIRTPLNLVLSPLRELRERESDPETRELYDLMYRNSLRMMRLVNQLMDIRKVDNGQMKMHFVETDVAFFMRDMMQSFLNLAKSRDIDFSLQCPDVQTRLWIDQDNFDKVIFNILSNAFKQTPEKGSISISISSPTPNDGSLEAGIREYVSFEISNSGSHVDESKLDRLFDRFFQADEQDARQGSGVGLNLAKMLVGLHHGDICARNTPEGMAFIIRIPVGKAHLKPEETARPAGDKDLYARAVQHHHDTEDVTTAPQHVDESCRNARTKRNIVLVDDDDEMRAYLKLELQSQYNVESFSNAKEAWSRICMTVPDAVITDLLMSGMNGAELCSKIRKNPGTNHIPVLILTSSHDEQSVERCNESGADRYLTKPVSLEILKGAIANAISTRDTIRNKFSKVIDYGYADMNIPDSGNQLIDKVIKVIKENIDNSDFGVVDLSREVGMSRVHLNRKLKEAMNISPNNLIRSVRLKQAAYLLLNSNINISEVAYRVGFSSCSYFSNSFHDYFGLSPKEFVNTYSGNCDEETFRKILDIRGDAPAKVANT